MRFAFAETELTNKIESYRAGVVDIYLMPSGFGRRRRRLSGGGHSCHAAKAFRTRLRSLCCQSDVVRVCTESEDKETPMRTQPSVPSVGLERVKAPQRGCFFSKKKSTARQSSKFRTFSFTTPIIIKRTENVLKSRSVRIKGRQFNARNSFDIT